MVLETDHLQVDLAAAPGGDLRSRANLRSSRQASDLEEGVGEGKMLFDNEGDEVCQSVLTFSPTYSLKQRLRSSSHAFGLSRYCC